MFHADQSFPLQICGGLIEAEHPAAVFGSDGKNFRCKFAAASLKLVLIDPGVTPFKPFPLQICGGLIEAIRDRVAKTSF